MTDLEIVRQFYSLLGFSVREKFDDQGNIIFASEDTAKSPNVITQGYDEIMFAGRFNQRGKMLNSYMISHVACHPEEFGKMFYVSEEDPD